MMNRFTSNDFAGPFYFFHPVPVAAMRTDVELTLVTLLLALGAVG